MATHLNLNEVESKQSMMHPSRYIKSIYLHENKSCAAFILIYAFGKP